MHRSSPIGLQEPRRYGFGICPVSQWFCKLATMSSSICDRVRSCIRANLGAEYDARSPFTTFVNSHSLYIASMRGENYIIIIYKCHFISLLFFVNNIIIFFCQLCSIYLNIGPFSKTDCSQRYGLYAPTSSLVTTDTSYRVGFRLIRADTRTCCMSNVILIWDADAKGLTNINVCKKWLFMHAGLNGVLSASRKTTHTMSLPMCRLRCNFCGSCFSYGNNVDTWNIISMLRQFVYTEYSPKLFRLLLFCFFFLQNNLILIEGWLVILVSVGGGDGGSKSSNYGGVSSRM